MTLPAAPAAEPAEPAGSAAPPPAAGSSVPTASTQEESPPPISPPPPHPPGRKRQIKGLFLDCDNTIALTEEHAFAGTTQTINTLLADFKVPRQRPSRLTSDSLRIQQGLLLDGGDGLPEQQQQQQQNGQSITIDATDSVSDEGEEGEGEQEVNTYQTYSTASLLADYIGLPFRHILAGITARHELSLTAEQSRYYSTLEEANVNAAIEAKASAAPHIKATLNSLSSSSSNKFHFTHIIVVSSSPLARIRSALSAANLYPHPFNEEHLFSAHDSLPAPEHKPSPAVYLHALASTGLDAESCLAVEDSVGGCLSALGAGIDCLGYVGALHDPGKRAVVGRVLREKGAKVVFDRWDGFADVLGELGC